MIAQIGALIIVKVNFQLSRQITISGGDYGIEIFLFKHEMQLVTK